MRAALLEEVRKPLQLKEIPKPIPNADEVLIKVHVCAICRTDLHIMDGELPHPKLPLILGHQIVGIVETIGKNVNGFKVGDRVGVPWLGFSCQKCAYCLTDKENLCDNPEFTGYTKNGGFAEYATADYRYIFHLPKEYSDKEIAPLLCGGLIGYRALTMTEPAKKIGFYGFGSSAHILAQVAKHQGKEVYAFTRKGDKKKQEFAKSLGAVFASDSETKSPQLLDAAIIFAPVGDLIPKALASVKKGGVVVSAEIHMSDIPSFPYKLLWEERVIRSVANLTRKDGIEFLSLISQFLIQTKVTSYPLTEINQAFDDLRMGNIEGTALIILD